MTVIAYKDGEFAVDKMGTLHSVGVKFNKFEKFGNEYLVSTGTIAQCNRFKRWYKEGACHDKFPARPELGDCNVIVFGEFGYKYYENDSQPVFEGKTPFAWGCGAHFALGAMAAGKSASEAVAIANKLNLFCGLGVDTFRVIPIKKKPKGKK